ncbi:hypothetical protein [Rhodomicrobium udaipurense]|nr:hypothetical protein [Rhodomicrobium udaipurense]
MLQIVRRVSHVEARAAARRLIEGALRRDGEVLSGDRRPRISIPAKLVEDDDMTILAYIAQQEKRG